MPALTATIGANSDGMLRELTRVQVMARRAGLGIQAGLAGSGRAPTGAIQEVIVLMREIMRGNLSRVPGSLTLLAQRMGFLKYLLKDTRAEALAYAEELTKVAIASEAAAKAAGLEAYYLSLNTGAAVESTAAIEAKAVADREAAAAAMLNVNAVKAALGPLGWLLIAITAVAAAAFFLVRHFRTLAEEAKNLHDIMDLTRGKFTDFADAMRESADEAQKFDDWLKRLGEHQLDLANNTEKAIGMMEEQARYERELAEQRGASKAQLAQMDIATAQKALDMAKAARDEAEQKLGVDKAAAVNAENLANNTENKFNLKTAEEHTKEMAEVVAALTDKMKDSEFIVPGPIASGLEGPYQTHVARKGNEQDVFEVKVGGKPFKMSVAEATDKFQKLAAAEDGLIKAQQKLTDAARDGVKVADKDQEAYDKLVEKVKELTDELGLKSQYLPQLAGSVHNAVAKGNMTANQQIGAYAGGGVLADIGRRQLHELQGLRRDVKALKGNRSERKF